MARKTSYQEKKSKVKSNRNLSDSMNNHPIQSKEVSMICTDPDYQIHNQDCDCYKRKVTSFLPLSLLKDQNDSFMKDKI